MPKSYPAEFRRRVLALIAAGKPVGQVAADLQISSSVIYRWREQELVDSGLKPGTSRVQSAELVAARRRIRELETELAVTRRAAELLREAVPPKDDSRRSPR
jgi:transposase-like protein